MNWIASAALLLARVETATTAQDLHWPPQTVQGAMLTTAGFAIMGIVLAIIGFKLFDWLTPGSLQKEVLEKNNIAAGILGAAVILGICLIIAAAVHS